MAQIFILGNQKSGTSAVAALLSQAAGLSLTLDLKLPGAARLYPALRNGELKLKNLVKKYPKKFSAQIVKEPDLTLFYEEIAKLFPDARFVYVIREPKDNIRSLLDRFIIPGNLEELDQSCRARLVKSWPLVFDGAWLGFPAGNYCERLAHRWNYFAGLYLRYREKFHLVRYEDFIKDKKRYIEELVKTLGLALRRDVSDSVDRAFQPLGVNRGLPPERFFNASNLERINRICGESARSLGYST